jgi:hypothetical protein
LFLLFEFWNNFVFFSPNILMGIFSSTFFFHFMTHRPSWTNR